MAETISTRRKVKHPYITRRKGVCGGKPIIKGTRIKVSQIAIYYEKMNYSPDDIIEAHPHLTLPQIHDALSYYYENREEIDRQIADERKLVDEMKKNFVSILESKHNDA